MTEGQPPLDFLLKWKDQGQRAGPSGDQVSVQAEAAPAEEEELEEAAPEEDLEGFEAYEAELVADQPADAAELFEWSADREQAIFDALRELPQGAVPRVHAQLGAIHQGLATGGLDKSQALGLLAEVEQYLQERVQGEQRKTPVAHEAFIGSRADKLNALFAWSESAAALREFLESGEAVHLKVAAYAAEQANAYLNGARNVLLAADPDA